MRDNRIVITADLDCPRLLAIAQAAGPSVVLFRGGDWGDLELIARMRQFHIRHCLARTVRKFC